MQPQAMSTTDAYTPQEIARLVEAKGVTKAKAPALTLLALGVLAGAFIGLGGVFSTLVGTEPGLGYGPTRLLMGAAFSLGLILVVLAGAELFTGNNLVIMSWVSRRITLWELLRSWALVYAGNLAGALSIVLLVYYAAWWRGDGGEVGASAVSIAAGKASLSFGEAFVRGILANALVCLAVWLAMGGRSLTDKVLAIVFPVTAFVAAGFEHSIANMYFLPLGQWLKGEPALAEALGGTNLCALATPEVARNLIASTLGNIVGGAGMVGLVYWFIYLRRAKGSNAEG